MTGSLSCRLWETVLVHDAFPAARRPAADSRQRIG